MIFLNFLKLFLLVAGPLIGYQVAMRQLTARRWQVMAWCGAGGAVAAVMLIGMMLLSELSSFATAGDLARAAFPVIGEYTLFGLVGGFVIVLIPIAWTDPLLLGARIIVVIAVIVVAIDAAAYSLSEKRAKGLVFGPDNVPAQHASVFLDAGHGLLVRMTTDTAGQFRAPLVSRDYPHAIFLICVPGGMPRLARPLENVVNVYNVSALPRHSRVRSSLRAEGWLGSIPRECLGDSVKR